MMSRSRHRLSLNPIRTDEREETTDDQIKSREKKQKKRSEPETDGKRKGGMGQTTKGR